jgi:Thioesterase-like superfamily
VHSVFFEPAGPDTFVSTEATQGPWSPGAQHGGPPSALAAHVLESFQPTGRQRLATVTVDILRPVPVGKLTARSRVVRPGRRITLLETILEADGQEVLQARGWRLETAAEPVPATVPAVAPPAIPAEQPPASFAGVLGEGYLAAMEWRYVAGGGFDDPGPAAVWVRPRIPLLPGAELSPMCRALLVADSGNGISSVLPPTQYLFVNVDLKVALHRDPVGEWLLLDAVTDIGAAGTGLAASTLSDTLGPCGRGTQTLLVAPR